jgi:hypothetical protein
MKNQNTLLITIVSALAFALAPETKAAPGPLRWPPPPTGAEDVKLPVITIHGTDNVTRGKTGSLILEMQHRRMLGGIYVNLSVSGTAVAGVDYVAILSPAYIGQSGYGVIQVKTLHDPRGLSSRQAYSVTVTLEPGAGYAVGEASSATMWIKPALQSSNQSSN